MIGTLLCGERPGSWSLHWATPVPMRSPLQARPGEDLDAYFSTSGGGGKRGSARDNGAKCPHSAHAGKPRSWCHMDALVLELVRWALRLAGRHASNTNRESRDPKRSIRGWIQHSSRNFGASTNPRRCETLPTLSELYPRLRNARRPSACKKLLKYLQ